MHEALLTSVGVVFVLLGVLVVVLQGRRFSTQLGRRKRQVESVRPRQQTNLECKRRAQFGQLPFWLAHVRHCVGVDGARSLIRPVAVVVAAPACARAVLAVGLTQKPWR